ncbi:MULTISPECIES: hypothetical protein [Streptomyces]|uniref:Uncharacterized protein n=2 Tax=Streptomyces TaxID=1883 RepID=A0ABS9JD78_9ACTN|nr:MULTISPECIES: hypothetical protein [Streptomyces]MCG0063513.1 hypothetical protein [Streptomyces tricolor]OYP16617.1 hypothetical protein CFC35_20660 [Streptomyces sp. FBKL.4005]BCM67979.1 hypothetical protein EASAB2608_03313 [Streptomyces sp. EAS-AB2608]CUW29181.1 hypothetical protein TUE45_03915 [Streptomyces reticuli]
MDFTIIKHAVEVDDGIKRLSMRFIKKHAAPERARLSAELCAEIGEEFERIGLTTLPRTLPTSENEFVWVIKRDSALGEVAAVAAALADLEKLKMNPLPQVFANYPLAQRYLS